MSASNTQTAERRLLESIAMSLVDTPRVFTFASADRSRFDPRNVWSSPVKLTLWCTHPGQEHPVHEASYNISQPKEWFVSALPHLKRTLQFLRFTPIVRGVLGESSANEIASHLEVLDVICRTLDDVLAQEKALVMPRGLRDQREDATSIESPSDRAVKKLLLSLRDIDWFQPLHRVIGSDGNIHWVCPAHLKNYSEADQPIENLSAASIPQKEVFARRLSHLVKATIFSFLGRPDCYSRIGGRDISLADLLDPLNDLRLSWPGWDSVPALHWINRERERLYHAMAREKSELCIVRVALLHPDISPATNALQEAVTACHEVVPGAKPIRCRIEWIDKPMSPE